MPDFLVLNLYSSSHGLCDLGKVSSPPQASILSSFLYLYNWHDHGQQLHIPPKSSHLHPIPLGSFLLPSCFPTTSMSLFTQLFCRYPALQIVHDCNGHSISRRQHFTALLHILFLLHIFCPIFQNGSWALGGGHDTDVSFGAKHSAVIHSHCFHQLWVSGFIVPHWKKKLLWPRMRAGIPSCVQWIQ